MWWTFLFLCLTAVVIADNDFTFTGTPVPGQPFTITWTPGTYSKVDVMLNSIIQGDIVTTSDPLAIEIDNTGSWIWNVPLSIQGRYSLSIARDVRFLVSYSQPFILGTFSSISSPPPDTSVPQSTACTSAVVSVPSPTGVNPFLFPSENAFRVRAGIQSTIKWIPTTSGSVSIFLTPGDYAASTTNIQLTSKIPNSGSYSWTPNIDLANNDYPLYSYRILLVDDADSTVTSSSETIDVLSPSFQTEFTDPYIPAVIGRPFLIQWSPSNTPSISLILQKDIPVNPPPNITVGDHIKNSGSYTWQVPLSSTFVIPGVWWLAAIDDATGNLDARIQITIDATTPPSCGSDPASNDASTTLIEFSTAATTATAVIAASITGNSISTATTELNAATTPASATTGTNSTIINSIAPTAESELPLSTTTAHTTSINGGVQLLTPAGLGSVLFSLLALFTCL